MHEDEDSIFNVIHSLPVLSCSVALAQRTPAAGYGQQTKYMPDYGGYLETASSRLKNNALASGFAFDINPKKFSIRLSNPDNRSTSIFPNDCLTVTSYLHSDNLNDLSVIRQLGSIVTFDLLTQLSEDEPYVTARYDCIASKDRNPRGLKQVKNSHDDYLLIKFAKSVKIYNLNRVFNYAVAQEETNSSAHKRVASIKDRTGYDIRDASLSHMNKSYLGIASDNANIHSIKLYDLSSSRREPLQNIEWATVENEFPSIDTCLLSKELRGRVIRTFIPMRPTNWGTQQLDHIPSHLCNLLVTNEHKISLVDPRSDSLVLNLLSKAELPSFYPIEYLRKTVFSNKNDHQFYSMTNVHLRVVDTRYPGVPLGQIGHMLESESYNSMDMKLISYPDSDLESLCCSSMSRLCFMTFDQAQIGNLINPKSTHLPYHDSNLNDRAIEGDLPAFGLSAIVPADTRKTNFDAFSIFQLSLQGDLLLRSYSRTGTSNFERFSPRMGLISEDEQASENSPSLVPIREAHEIPDRVIVENQNPPSPEDRIDLLDSSFLEEIENRLESKRAQEKYELMKKKLCGI